MSTPVPAIGNIMSGPRVAPGSGAERPGSRIPWVRLTRVALAVYLLPALFVTVLVAGVGIAVLTAVRTIAGAAHVYGTWTHPSS